MGRQCREDLSRRSAFIWSITVLTSCVRSGGRTSTASIVATKRDPRRPARSPTPRPKKRTRILYRSFITFRILVVTLSEPRSTSFHPMSAGTTAAFDVCDRIECVGDQAQEIEVTLGTLLMKALYSEGNAFAESRNSDRAYPSAVKRSVFSRNYQPRNTLRKFPDRLHRQYIRIRSRVSALCRMTGLRPRLLPRRFSLISAEHHLVFNDVIRRQRISASLCFGAQDACGSGDGGSGVAGDRFENDLTRLDADFARLFRDQKAVFFVISMSGEAVLADTRREFAATGCDPRPVSGIVSDRRFGIAARDVCPFRLQDNRMDFCRHDRYSVFSYTIRAGRR